MTPRRYLVPFGPKDTAHRFTDVLVIGAGIAGLLAPEDCFENHVEDTLTAGAGLCDRAVVELVVREAPQQIHDLVNWGTKFDLEAGHLALTREAGHSHAR